MKLCKMTKDTENISKMMICDTARVNKNLSYAIRVIVYTQHEQRSRARLRNWNTFSFFLFVDSHKQFSCEKRASKNKNNNEHSICITKSENSAAATAQYTHTNQPTNCDCLSQLAAKVCVFTAHSFPQHKQNKPRIDVFTCNIRMSKSKTLLWLLYAKRSPQFEFKYLKQESVVSAKTFARLNVFSFRPEENEQKQKILWAVFKLRIDNIR